MITHKKKQPHKNLSKKLTSKKSTNRTKSKIMPGKRPLQIGTAVMMYEPQISSYEETLLNGIISKRKGLRTTETALIFNSVLSTLTPGLRNLYYRSGVSLGRSLYRLYHQKRRYMWYEESVADLVSFFETCGFSQITYNVFPEKIELKFHNCSKGTLGTNVHVFEAGIVCGFLTTGKQQHVRVQEIACSSNGSDYCHFVTSDSLPLYLESNGQEVLQNFIRKISRTIHTRQEPPKSIPEEYYALSSSVFIDPEYQDHINKVVYYLGRQTALNLGEYTKSKSRSTSQTYEGLFHLLNLGELKLKSLRPVNATIHLDRLKAKKEFVDISITFLNGLLSGKLSKNSLLEARTARSGNAYLVKIFEKSNR